MLITVTLFLPLVVSGDSRPSGPHWLLSEADRFAMLYNWPQAASRYAQAESMFGEAGDRRNALLARLGYFWASADAGVSPTVVDEVSTHLDDPFVQSDNELLMRALVTKAVLDRNANELTARGPWERILELAKAVGDHEWEARAKAELGQILYMDGDIKTAAGMVRDAIVAQYLGADFGAAIHYTAMVGNGFVETGQPEAGLQYSNLILRLNSLVPDRGYPFLAHQGKARALLAMNRPDEAASVLSVAISQAREEKNYFALAQLLVVAGMASASKEPSRGIAYLSEASAISEGRGFHHVFAWSTIELAEAHREIGMLDEAEAAVSKAVELMRRLEDRYHLPQHLALFADLETRKGNYARADAVYSEATDVINGLLANVVRRQLKSSLIATLSEAYVGHFELAATKMLDAVKAFEIIEEARGRAMADTLRGESETLTTVDEITAESQREISRIQVALLHETNRSVRQDLLDRLFTAEQLLSPARKTTSVLAESGTRPKPIPLRDLQSTLRPDEAILEYVLAEPNSYCLKITRENIRVIMLPAGRDRIESLVDGYLEAVKSRASEAAVSKELFSATLASVLGAEPQSRLIVVPDGKLNLLPFDALRDSDGRYVLESHVVTYAPSATVLHLLRRDPAEGSPLGLVAVGGAIYSGSAVSRTPVELAAADLFGLDGVTFPKLPGSKQEIHSIDNIIRGSNKLLFDSDATEAGFKAMPLESFRLVHLAVHGVANTQFPDRAALILGTSPASPDDGLLQVREIRDLPLRADLVVLSACETGSGKLLGAEGIASLERAFLLAGAKAVVASLWTADDIFTIALMKRFYQHLAIGSEKGAALRQAKLDLLQEFGNQAVPVYWAGFTLVGEGSQPVLR
jgi:CHAT domain-containing protein